MLKKWVTFVFVKMILASWAIAGAKSMNLAELEAFHLEIGSAMDKAYYDAGSQLDIVVFDLRELQKQGKNVDANLLKNAENAGNKMRTAWLKLDSKRAAIKELMKKIPIGGDHVLSITGLENVKESEGGWFGFQSATIQWKNGTRLDIPLTSFRNAAFAKNYHYLCDKSDAIFVYGIKTGQNVATAGFDLPKEAKGNAQLILSGLDCDKLTRTTIQIAVDGSVLFKGKNLYQKTNWSEHKYPIKASAFVGLAACNNVVTAKSLYEKFVDLAKEIESFKNESIAITKFFQNKTKSLRKGLVYQTQPIAKDWWKKGFMRGMYIESRNYKGFPLDHVSRDAYAYHNYEYIVKWIRDMGGNMIYSYNRDTAQKPFLKEVDKLQIPYIQCGWGWDGCDGIPYANDEKKWRIRDQRYYSNKEAHLKDIMHFAKVRSGGFKTFTGVAVDEPIIDEGTHQKLNILDQPKIVKGFTTYIQAKRPQLEAAGIKLPQQIKPVVKVNSKEDYPLFMEWQQYKINVMAEHFDWLWKQADKQDLFLFHVIMNRNQADPQLGSYTGMGRLPLISTDLYHNGNIVEGYCMQLLRNATDGKALLTPGSTYASRTPARFKRSLAVGHAHADGVAQWIELYCNKYRNAGFFWQEKMRSDDRGKDLLQCWMPEAYEIQEQYFHMFEDAEKYLTDTSSATKAIVLRSEKTVYANINKSTREYSKCNLGLYSDLVNINVPIEAGFIENMTEGKLDNYKVAILADALVVSEKEANAIRNWVNNGGTLIASGQSSLYDQWAREQREPQLADVFGILTKGERKTGASYYRVADKTIAYDKQLQYLKVFAKDNANVIGRYNDGSIAVVENNFGKGKCYYFSALKLGERASQSEGEGGIYSQGFNGLDALLKQFISQNVGAYPIKIENLPKGVEFYLREKDGNYIVHLIDWMDDRILTGLKVKINDAADWNVFYPYNTDKNIHILGKNYVQIDSIDTSEMLVVKRR